MVRIREVIFLSQDAQCIRISPIVRKNERHGFLKNETTGPKLNGHTYWILSISQTLDRSGCSRDGDLHVLCHGTGWHEDLSAKNRTFRISHYRITRLASNRNKGHLDLLHHLNCKGGKD